MGLLMIVAVVVLEIVAGAAGVGLGVLWLGRRWKKEDRRWRAEHKDFWDQPTVIVINEQDEAAVAKLLDRDREDQ